MGVLSDLGANVLICGDFNPRHPFWGCAGTNPAGTVLFQEVTGSDMLLHFPSSGATPSRLDLAMTKGFPALSGLSADSMLSSDRCTVLFDLVEGVQLDSIPHQIFKDYAAADWYRYASLISDRVELLAS